MTKDNFSLMQEVIEDLEISAEAKARLVSAISAVFTDMIKDFTNTWRNLEPMLKENSNIMKRTKSTLEDLCLEVVSVQFDRDATKKENEALKKALSDQQSRG